MRTQRRPYGRLPRFDPTGNIATDLAGCLSLQLAARDRWTLPCRRAGNLELLARRDFAASSDCGVDEEDLLDMLAEIRALDPRPGLAFSGGAAPIIADVEVRAAADGSGRWS